MHPPFTLKKYICNYPGCTGLISTHILRILWKYTYNLFRKST